MKVDAEGFFGGDRTRIDLPAPQEKLLERVHAVGKPTVLLLSFISHWLSCTSLLCPGRFFVSRAFTKYNSKPAPSRMSYTAIQYTPVDCIATVRIPHCFSQTAISFALDLSRHLSPLLAVHLLPIALRWAADCFLGFLVLLVFHANRSTLNSTWLGPVSETYSISPAGSGPYPFQDNAATIYTIANTGAMLI